MKKRTLLIGTTLLLALSLSSCTASADKYRFSMVKHPTTRFIPEIDQLVIKEGNKYIQDCYGPVRDKFVPNNQCQNKLFELVERRSGSNYKVNQLNMAATEIFFNEVDNKIEQLINSNSNVRNSVRQNFKSKADLVSYYKASYNFDRFY